MVRAAIFCILALFLGSTQATDAKAQLAIDRLWVDLDDQRANRSDLVVRNESEDVYYITVTTSEIENPGTAGEMRTTQIDPEKLGLLVTPNRLILRPGELRAIRVVSLNRDLAQDRIYRVNINPEIGELSIDQDDLQNRGLAIKLLAAFDVLVTVRPREGDPELVALREGDRIELRNEGSSNLLMLDGKVCPVEGTSLSGDLLQYYRSELVAPVIPDEFSQEEQEDTTPPEVLEPQLPLTEDGCLRLPGRRLHAGNSWPVAADDSAQLQFMVRRNANEDLRPLIVRCSTRPQDNSNSDFCRMGGAEAVTGAAPDTPAQL